ncbi:retron St85 family effector protein [Idiomarina loihiensis]|uniref:retron St85 family effector protein n=1 Tax=Idiomarina loihiensis TaxID=135577 RepID=UPI003158764F
MAFYNELLKLYKDEVDCMDLSGSRVSLYDDRLFLCGGTLSDIGEPKSFRQVIVNLIDDSIIPREKLVLAEEKFNNTIFNEYSSSLTDFELLISEFSTSIAIVLESTGSFAEIGAFSLKKEIVEKLFVYIQQEFSEQVSFINSGPLKVVKEDRKFIFSEKFCSYDAAEKRDALLALQEDQDLKRAVLDTVQEDIFKSKHKSEPFNKQNDFHKMVFVAEIISNSVPLSFREVEEILDYAGLELPQSRLRLSLRVAEDFGLLQKIANAKAYYIAPKPYAGLKVKSNSSKRVIDLPTLKLQAKMLLTSHKDEEYKRMIAMKRSEG